MTTNSMNNMR